jgi:hypothetical protein
MPTAPDLTTGHGSTGITLSEVFCCGACGAPVALVVLPGGDLAYECQGLFCGKTIPSDHVEDLAVRDELAIILPTPRVPIVEVVEWV